MKAAAISFVLGIFFFALTYYFYSYESPFKQDKLNELIIAQEIEPNEVDILEQEIDFIISRGLVLEYLSPNAYIALISLILGILCIFFTMHLIVDKLFFKTLIDPPNYKLAIQRVVLGFFSFLLFFYLKFQAVQKIILFLPFVISFIIDYLLIKHFELRKINGSSKETDKDIVRG